MIIIQVNAMRYLYSVMAGILEAVPSCLPQEGLLEPVNGEQANANCE